MRFFSLANRNLKEIYRDPISILLGILLPLIMLLLFSSLNKTIQLDLFSPQAMTPGIIIFSYTFIIMFSAMLLAKDKQSAFLIRLFTTPLKPTDYILAYILPFIPLAFAQAAICFIVGIILGASFSQVGLSILIFLIIAIICISIGVIIGSLFTVNQASGIGSILVTLVGLMSGVWMDLKMVGGIFEKIGYALPFAHAVDAAKGILSGQGFFEIATHIYFILVSLIILMVLAILSFRRTMIKL